MTTEEEVVVADDKTQPFKDLRGVQWRIDLGVLPHSTTSSIDNLRRVTADSRRRYASLRRRLLVDPHISKDGRNSPDLAVDNPLSQNPDSMWGRFFRSAELEKMVDQDLLRLYPEDGSYFQTTGCQGMLRRILLLWCLSHPEYGYRQGMHELLAPLVYVLHVDIEHLSQVQKLYEDHFTDKFDELSVYEDDQTYTFDYRRFSDTMEDDSVFHENAVKARSINELDPEVQKIILLSDAYGAEGELGIVLSEKFMEHDAYSMFDALMSGVNGSVAMADFFSHSPAGGCKSSLSPVIEASAGLYHLLSVVDSPLHCHLIELGVEPQYFALRWLRVLFGREFALEDLFLIWDEIFAQDNSKLDTSAEDDGFEILNSSRGAFIAAMAVSMILYLRSSLFAAETATSCLQKLLNFPQNIDLHKLIEKAKSLQILALDVNNTHKAPQAGGTIHRGKPAAVRGHSLSSDFNCPTTPLSLVPDSYWEEMWRVLHKEEEHKKDTSTKEAPSKRRSWSEKVRLRLSRTESDPSSTKVESGKRNMRSSIRRSLLEDLSQQLGDDEISEEISCPKILDHKSVEGMAEGQKVHNDSSSNADDEDRRISGNGASEENSSIFSDPASPLDRAMDHENDSEKSSTLSNMSIDEHDNHQTITVENSPLPLSDVPESTCIESGSKNDSAKKNLNGVKERKGKFQWLWSFGRNTANEEKHDRRDDSPETSQSTTNNGDDYNDEIRSAAVDESSELPVGSKGDTADHNVISPLKNIGQTMLEHIQVIESVFQQERGQGGSLESFSKNVLVGKGQVTAMAALKELRKISNLLSEM